MVLLSFCIGLLAAIVGAAVALIAASDAEGRGGNIMLAATAACLLGLGLTVFSAGAFLLDLLRG